MRSGILLAVIISSFLLFQACSSKPSEKKQSKSSTENSGYKLVAYVAGYRDYDFTQIDADGITHINYAFGNIRNGQAVFDTTKIDGKNLTPVDLEKLVALKTKNPNLKILISIGGWSWSGGFSDAALTEQSRAVFAKSCATMVNDYRLDGIDLDWEYPNQPGAGNTYRPEDVQNFTLMLQKVRESLDEMARAEGKEKHYLLTIATGADMVYVDNTNLGEVQKYLDFINIMTYDFYNGWHNTNGHHSNLSASANPDKDMNSVLNAVSMHLKAGVPAKKLNLGIPFYGRIWKGVDASDDEILFNKAETVGMGIDYVDFCENINANGFTRFWDENAQAPYLWNPVEKTFISYEDEQSIALKINYLKEQGLGGVMFWEYAADKDKKLLNAVRQGLKK
ncbi:glycoside hydrolase family 18 protein [uncultured Draconibacterium sp.]|uniref:glycoside hydrolase family 18 protein n=1 Tax=uncultured Draconibacterium sp. TaxID=1573823 RepID=UPI0025FEBDEF|nr:glycoside hydrolase family 18 protein [uncultured Draconibacterium sp.]